MSSDRERQGSRFVEGDGGLYMSIGWLLMGDKNMQGSVITVL